MASIASAQVAVRFKIVDSPGTDAKTRLETDDGWYLIDERGLKAKKHLDTWGGAQDNSNRVTIDGVIWTLAEETVHRKLRAGDEKKWSSVTDIAQTGKTLWWVTTDGELYRVVGEDEPVKDGRLSDDAQMWVSFTEPGKWLVIRTSDAFYFVDEDGPRRICGPNFAISAVAAADQEVLLGSRGGGLYSTIPGSGGEPERDAEVPKSLVINHIFVRLPKEAPEDDVQASRRVSWLTTEEGVYRYPLGEKPKRIPNAPVRIDEICAGPDDRVWLVGEPDLLYRVDEDVAIKVVLQGSDYGFLSKRVWVGNVLTPEVMYWDYKQDRRVTDYEQDDSHFQLTMHIKRSELDEAKTYGEHSAPSRSKVVLDGIIGGRSVCVSVRDAWGNEQLLDASGAPGDEAVVKLHGLLAPGPALVGLLTAAFCLFGLLIALALSPISIYCNNLLMNPYVRNIGSFGSIPLAITLVPFVRRHVLRRYLRTVASSDEFQPWRRQFLPPSERFEFTAFAGELRRRGRLLVHGESGIGKTVFLKYLMTHLADPGDAKGPIGDFIPVFLSPTIYGDGNLEEAFCSQLAKFGHLTDKDLALHILKQGGFVVLIDALNEVTDDARRSVMQFVDQYASFNLLCLSSQLSQDGIDRAKQIELAKLSEEKVEELLRRKLGDELAEEVLREFSPATYDLCRIPQHLEFAVQLVEQDKPVPSDKGKLVEGILEPVFEEWDQEGKGTYGEALFKRSYEMLCTADAFVDGEARLAQEWLDRLREMKLLTPRGSHVEFQHDKIRDYLAARYFTPRWESLLQEEPAVDYTWLPMLEFVVLQIEQPAEAKELLFNILERHSDLRFAKGLYQVIKVNRRQLMSYLGPDFFPRFVRLVFEAA